MPRRVLLDPDVPTRRGALRLLAAATSVPLIGCDRARAPESRLGADAIVSVDALPELNWLTEDPFLFCAHHHDAYPAGNDALGPKASLAGRRIGRDFDQKDGWNMYHGEVIPGFPRHPHRGFETVTVVRTGLLDHSDSLGATARYGNGDVQWLTAGAGIQHAEMFPLLRADRDNPLELFQIWLNLPAATKMVAPYFSMLWSEKLPPIALRDDQGHKTTLTVVAGPFREVRPPEPPPDSYAAHVDAHVAIWTLELEDGATFTLPAEPTGTVRSLYFHAGDVLHVGGRAIPASSRVVTRGDSEVVLIAGAQPASVLLLSGRPLGEPVAKHGPFVMNTEAEIRQPYADYRRTGFGGWPWTSDDHVHPRAEGRMAVRPDGSVERPA